MILGGIDLPLAALLVIPAVSAMGLALLPGYRLTARLNVLATFLTFLSSLSLFVERPEPGDYLFVDDLNVVFIVLGTFVGFTTSAFSASYIAHEMETGKLIGRVVANVHSEGRHCASVGGFQ